MQEPALIEVMKEVRDLLSDPFRWTKGTLARRADGKQTEPWSDNATCFCAIGATSRTVRQHKWRDSFIPFEKIVVQLEKHLPQKYIARAKYENEPRPLAIFNDDERTTHKDLLEIFDKTISDLEKN